MPLEMPGNHQTVMVTVPHGKLPGSRLVIQAGGKLVTDGVH
jgi:hypothetical protein